MVFKEKFIQVGQNPRYVRSVMKGITAEIHPADSFLTGTKNSGGQSQVIFG
jgi:hypothetical protein